TGELVLDGESVRQLIVPAALLVQPPRKRRGGEGSFCLMRSHDEVVPAISVHRVAGACPLVSDSAEKSQLPCDSVRKPAFEVRLWVCHLRAGTVPGCGWFDVPPEEVLDDGVVLIEAQFMHVMRDHVRYVEGGRLPGKQEKRSGGATRAL